MPVARARSSTITLSAAIERYFQVSLFLLVLTGFGTLAETGAVDAPTITLVGLALLFRGYLLSKRSDYQMPTRWTNYLTLAYVLFFFADYTMLSRSFLTATVHLVLFGMPLKLMARSSSMTFRRGLLRSRDSSTTSKSQKPTTTTWSRKSSKDTRAKPAPRVPLQPSRSDRTPGSGLSIMVPL